MYKDLQLQILQDFASYNDNGRFVFIAFAETQDFSFHQYASDNRQLAFARRRPEGLLTDVKKFTKTRETCTVEELRTALDLPATRATVTSLGLALAAVGWTKVNPRFTSWVSPTASAKTRAEQEKLARRELSQRMKEHRSEKRLLQASHATQRRSLHCDELQR